VTDLGQAVSYASTVVGISKGPEGRAQLLHRDCSQQLSKLARMVIGSGAPLLLLSARDQVVCSRSGTVPNGNV
jgi:hypothetical protein